MMDDSFCTILVLTLLVIASITIILCKYFLIPFIQFVFDFIKLKMRSAKQRDKCKILEQIIKDYNNEFVQLNISLDLFDRFIMEHSASKL